MQRQRKKDVSLKPNRVLDKRSSRGMIFENEELRLRTLAISDDVDRGHHDIKKLRKENDHLKREIWSLRDECEKLEEILKKVVISGTSGLDINDLPFPELFLDRNNDEFDDEGSSYMDDDDENNLIRTMFMTDDETGSVIELEQQQQKNLTFVGDGSENDQQSPGVEVSDSSPKFGAYHSMRFAGIPTDLAAVREESESLITIPQGEISIDDELPDPTQLIGELLLNSNNNHDFPVIQITPASSPSSAPIDTDLSPQPPFTLDPGNPFVDESGSPESIQEGGCVTVLPKMFQVTSQMHIEDRTENEADFFCANEPLTTTTTTQPLSVLPPPSPSTSQKFKKSSVASNRRKDLITNSKISSSSLTHHRHSLHGDQHSNNCNNNKRNTHPPASISTRQLMTTPPVGHQFEGSVGYIVNGCCHSCYQSEPSLTSGAGDTTLCNEYFDRPLNFDPLMYYQMSHSHFHPNKPNNGWNSIDKNLVVGYFVEEYSENIKIKPQDIIDELESKFDASLEKIKGIRMLPGRVFISLKDPQIVSAILDEFGSNSCGEQKEFLVKSKYKITFVDGSQEGYSVLTLSGIPPEVSDLAVISVLNQYGQVVAPLERRNYKGVDISERVVRMHLVKSLPTQLLIGGYEVSVLVVISSSLPSDECQEICTNSNRRQLLSTATSPGSEAHVRLNALKAPVITSANTKENPVGCSSSNPVTCHISPVTCHTVPVTCHPSPTQQLSQLQPKGAQSEELNVHKTIARSTSSNPRLESGVPVSPIMAKRQPSASVCAANLSPEEHPSKLFLKNPQLQKNKNISAPNSPNPSSGSTNTNSAPNLLPANTKKPLTRLLGSSPGLLKSTSSSGTKIPAPITQNTIESQQPQDSSLPVVAAVATNPTGLRAAFYRGLSFENRRRGSNTSQFAGDNNNMEKVGGAYSRRNSSNVLQGRYGGGHPHLTQMNSNSSSQYDSGRDSVRRFGNIHGERDGKPLPWCGCWGNGCI